LYRSNESVTISSVPAADDWRLPGPTETLAQYVRAARESRGATWDDLVRVTALSQSTIRKIEDGRTPNPGVFTLLRVWRALDLPCEGLCRLQQARWLAGQL